jgi:hypothetical protein
MYERCMIIFSKVIYIQEDMKLRTYMYCGVPYVRIALGSTFLSTCMYSVRLLNASTCTYKEIQP